MKYPFDSPEVVFVGDSIPVHQHIYSNGHICLSILTDDWSPALSVESVCLSIISMLASAKDKVRPSDDSFYVRTCSKNPKKTRWWYHDDSVWSYVIYKSGSSLMHKRSDNVIFLDSIPWQMSYKICKLMICIYVNIKFIRKIIYSAFTFFDAGWMLAFVIWTKFWYV